MTSEKGIRQFWILFLQGIHARLRSGGVCGHEERKKQ